MIDWYPNRPLEPTADLGRWRAAVNLRRLAAEVDSLHPGTVGHSERVAGLAARMAVACGWTADRVERLAEAARVHDVGKVCVPDAILLATGALTPQEYAIMTAHAPLGAEIVATALTPTQAAWVRHHHERWDGRGYPDRLAGDDIPAGAALLGAADAWDAMTRRAWSGPPLGVREAMRECRREAGRQFAPWAVDALVRALEASPGELPRSPARLRLVTAA